MSRTDHPIYTDKDFQTRGITRSELITPDNCDLILRKDSLRIISNGISNRTGKKFSPEGIQKLIGFIRELNPEQFYNLDFNQAREQIINGFISRYRIKTFIELQNKPESIMKITKLDQITPEFNLNEYQKKELDQFTKNENQYKYSNFTNRIGNAFIDRNRVDGNYSTPDSIPSGFQITGQEVNKSNYEALKLVKNFLDPESIGELINRISSTYTTFQSISLPRQIIPIDSKNRSLTNSNQNEYAWNINYASKPGDIGDIQVMDTITQIIQLKIGSFWLPLIPSTGYYDKIRMLIKEFISQSVLVNDFNISTGNNQPQISYFQFEFNITQTEADRVFLEPINPIYSFRKPISQLNRITVSFFSPFGIIPYQTDRDTYSITFGTNPTLLNLTNGTNNGLATGDLIYIIYAGTGTNLDTQLVSSSGFIITKTSQTQFSIPLDSTGYTGSYGGLEVYYGSRRIFFPLEFVCLEQ